MIKIWCRENKDGTVSFFDDELVLIDTYVYRKATFVYPKFLYDWIEIPCAE